MNMNPSLDDLDITREEFDRLKDAFKCEDFRKTFAEYCNEVQDPENKKIFQSEFTQLEREHGIDVTFVNPEPGFVIKTSINGTEKAFINVAHCDKVQPPISKVGVNEHGETGINWSLPYIQAPPRRDYDKKYNYCTVYDVVYHPQTLHLASKDSKFRRLVIDTSCDAVQNSYNVEIDRANLKFPKLKFKGIARPTVIRKKMDNPPEDVELSPLDHIYPKLKDPVPEVKHIPIPKTKPIAKYATPKYVIKHRRNVDFQEMTYELDAKMNLTVPKELDVIVDLPLLKTTRDVTLDVTEKQIYLISERPAKYQLKVDLPFCVDEKNGSAKFDVDTKKLTISLPVMRKKQYTILDVCREDSGVDSDHGSPKSGSVDSFDEKEPLITVLSSQPTEAVSTKMASDEDEKEVEFLDSSIEYSVPTFTFHRLDNNIAFTLHVKNTEPDSVVCKKFGTSIHIKLASVGSGYFPINYCLLIVFPSEVEEINDVEAEAWDNNVIVQLTLKNCDVPTFTAGLNETQQTEYQLNESNGLNTLNTDSDDCASVDIKVCRGPGECVIDFITSKKKDEDVETKEPTLSSTVHTAKQSRKNKKKKKKVRSLSESYCSELKEMAAEIEHHNLDVDEVENEDIGKHFRMPRSVSESSTDDVSSPLHKRTEFKSILKRRTSYNRSISESSVDDHYPYSQSIDVGIGSVEGIPEEDVFENGSDGLSESCKKTVRFDNVIHKQIFK